MNKTAEPLFLQKALAQIERAEKFQRMKQVLVTVLAFAAAFWWAYTKSGPDLGTEGITLAGVALIAAVCTAKILSAHNRNTKSLLTAIAALRATDPAQPRPAQD